MVFMQKDHKQILGMLGISLALGILSGLIFGYLYNQYIECFIIAISISITIWLFNALLYIFLTPKIKNLPKEKRLLYEIPSFFVTTLLGFIIPIFIFSKIFEIDFFKEKIFLINLVLLLLIYMMIFGLILSFKFYKELKEKEAAAQKLKTLAIEAELKALKSQINPHFLFNTLNSINALVTQNPKLSRKMIAHLSELLRTSLESYDYMLVPLKKELDFAHLYLEIEKIRFNNKIEFQENVDPKLLDIPFPALVLQPLLENAVKHGIVSSRKGGVIQLEIKQEGNLLKCNISNTVESIKTDNRLKSIKNGTGLTNIRQRLDFLYNENYSFQAEYSERDKFKVSFSFPLICREANG